MREMKNVLDGLASRYTNRTLNNQKAKRTKINKKNRISKDSRIMTKVLTCGIGIPVAKKWETGTEETFETIMTGNFLKLIQINFN